MRKLKTILYVLLFVLAFFLSSPVLARAGGGGSGGSGGGSGGSDHTPTHSTSRTNSSSPFVSIFTFMMMSGAIYGINRYYIFKKSFQTKKEIDKACEMDLFWDERELKRLIKESYYQIQKAWSQQDLETLHQYLTDDLYEQWQGKISWQQFKGEKNLLTGIRLLNKRIIEIHDDMDNNQDCFWVYIEGIMNDRIVNQDNETVEAHRGKFVEYWKFMRHENFILLDEIKQEDEVSLREE